MRRRAITVLAVCVVCAVAGCGDDGDDDQAVETYRSPVYGYTVRHPHGWSAVPAHRTLEPGQPPLTGDRTVDILGRNADTRVSRMELPGVLVAAQPVAPSMSAGAWAADVRGIVSFQKGCERPDATEPITVDGEEAVLLTYNECPEADGYLHYWVAVVHNDMGFHIVWFDDVGQADVDRPEVDALLRSFTFARD